MTQGFLTCAAAAMAIVLTATACAATLPDEPAGAPAGGQSSPVTISTFNASAPASATTTSSQRNTVQSNPTQSNGIQTNTLQPDPMVNQAELDQQLRDAAWDDDVTQAAELLARGADVNAKDDTLQSAYLISTSEGYLDLLRLALENGASINDKDSWNGTGLIRAAERGHWLVVGELLQAGIDRDHVNRIGYQAIHEAVWLGKDTDDYATTVRVLVAAGVELTRASGTEGLSPLEMARQRNLNLVEPTLVKAVTNPEFTDPDAELLKAALTGDADRVAFALRAGADMDARDTKERTPLLLAATGDHVETARVLIALGADPDALDGRHDTPWLVTGVTGSVAMLEALLPANPDLTIVNRYGGVSVIPASERGHVDYVQRVVATGIDVNHVNTLGWTALLEAVILGDGDQQHRDIVGILLAAGADPSIPDADGVTAVQHARSRKFSEMAAILEAG